MDRSEEGREETGQRSGPGQELWKERLGKKLRRRGGQTFQGGPVGRKMKKAEKFASRPRYTFRQESGGPRF